MRAVGPGPAPRGRARHMAVRRARRARGPCPEQGGRARQALGLLVAEEHRRHAADQPEVDRAEGERRRERRMAHRAERVERLEEGAEQYRLIIEESTCKADRNLVVYTTALLFLGRSYLRMRELGKARDYIHRAEEEDDEYVLTKLSLAEVYTCLLYTSPSPRDGLLSRMPSSA